MEKLEINRIRELRKEKGISLAEMSKELKNNFDFEITPDALGKYERGVREPKLKTWQKIADFFDVPVSYIQGYGESISELRKRSLYIIDHVANMNREDLPEEVYDRLDMALSEFERYLEIKKGKKVSLMELTYDDELDHIDYYDSDNPLYNVFSVILTKDFLISLSLKNDIFSDAVLASCLSEKIENYTKDLLSEYDKNGKDRYKLGVDVIKFDKKIIDLEMNLNKAWNSENKRYVKNELNSFIDYLQKTLNDLD